MANRNESFETVQKQRLEKAESIVGRSQAMEGGLKVPYPVPRYVGTEETDSEILWAYFGDSLEQIALDYESSDTDGVFRYRVYDLDTDKKHVPVFRVIRWVEIEN